MSRSLKRERERESYKIQNCYKIPSLFFTVLSLAASGAVSGFFFSVSACTLLEILDFPADFSAESSEKSAGNRFPADFAKDLHSQVIPLWVIVS